LSNYVAMHCKGSTIPANHFKRNIMDKDDFSTVFFHVNSLDTAKFLLVQVQDTHPLDLNR